MHFSTRAHGWFPGCPAPMTYEAPQRHRPPPRADLDLMVAHVSQLEDMRRSFHLMPEDGFHEHSKYSGSSFIISTLVQRKLQVTRITPLSKLRRSSLPAGACGESPADLCLRPDELAARSSSSCRLVSSGVQAWLVGVSVLRATGHEATSDGRRDLEDCAKASTRHLEHLLPLSFLLPIVIIALAVNASVAPLELRFPPTRFTRHHGQLSRQSTPFSSFCRRQKQQEPVHAACRATGGLVAAQPDPLLC